MHTLQHYCAEIGALICLLPQAPYLARARLTLLLHCAMLWPPVMYTLECNKHFSGAMWTSARNGQRTSSTPNSRTFCIHAVLRNIISYIRSVSLTPIWTCVNSKLEVYCEKSLPGLWTSKTDFRYGVVNNRQGNIRKCLEPTGFQLGRMRKAQNGRPTTDAPVVIWNMLHDKVFCHYRFGKYLLYITPSWKC